MREAGLIGYVLERVWEACVIGYVLERVWEACLIGYVLEQPKGLEPSISYLQLSGQGG